MTRSRPGRTPADERALVRSLVRWFRASARDLPWRGLDPVTGRRNPYHSLVSEVMLQQTQVSRVLDKFGPFLARFPDVATLASADDGDVLAEWSGMGYYRRARLLQGAAREMVRSHGGDVPDNPAELAALPGIGRYTAGAISSICFGRAEPIVDGNVKRVLMRLDAKRGAQSGPAVDRWAWGRAAALVGVAASLRPPAPGEFNEGLMELGATICTPRTPHCGQCPLRVHCGALRKGLQAAIPPARPRARRRVLYCASVVVPDREGRLLVERRPNRGMWAGLWQAPTIELETKPGVAEAKLLVEGASPGPVVAEFEHGTTHRDVRFVVRRAPILGPAAVRRLADADRGRRWLLPEEIARLALSNPQRRILLTIGAGGVP